MATKAQVMKMRVLLSKTGNTALKEAIVAGFSNGRTESLSELDQGETKALIDHLNKLDPNFQASEKMRRKIISMAHEMQWHIVGTRKIDMKRVDGWCQQFGYLKKKMDDYTFAELPTLVTQFEKAYITHIKNIK